MERTLKLQELIEELAIWEQNLRTMEEHCAEYRFHIQDLNREIAELRAEPLGEVMLKHTGWVDNDNPQ